MFSIDYSEAGIPSVEDNQPQKHVRKKQNFPGSHNRRRNSKDRIQIFRTLEEMVRNLRRREHRGNNSSNNRKYDPQETFHNGLFGKRKGRRFDLLRWHHNSQHYFYVVDHNNSSGLRRVFHLFHRLLCS